MPDSLSLFDEDTQDKVKYLYVVKDMQPAEMSIAEIFDSAVYYELLAVTFVASPKFFYKAARAFKKISLILGIQDGNLITSFTNGLEELLNPKKRAEFWNQLDEEVQANIRNNNYSVKYGQVGTSIHSKIYLMKGMGRTRLVLGSANLTEMAFSEKKQFEEVLVFDDSPLFEVYLARFAAILEHTVDYIPEYIKRQQNKDLIQYDDPELLSSILLDELEKGRAQVCVSEAVMEEIKSVADKAGDQVDEAKKVIEIIEIVTKKDNKTAQYKLKPAAEIQKKVAGIKTILSVLHKKSVELDKRSQFIYNKTNHLLYTRINETTNETDNELTLISKPFEDTRLLKDRLRLIDKFVDAYNLFTAREDVNNQSRIYEAILYGFMSPYM